MLCGQTQALAKRGNLERHHVKPHPKFQDSYPPKSRLRAKKVEELKSGLKNQQSLFLKKPFTDGEIVKEAMAITAETMFCDFKNKEKSCLRSTVFHFALQL